MAEGHDISGSDNEAVGEPDTELYQLKLDGSDWQYLQPNGERLIWTSDLESLKNFVENCLQQQGKWTSPGGNNKQFKSCNDKLVITWYFKKQLTLVFQGQDGPFLKEKLFKLVQDKPEMTTDSPNRPTSQNENQQTTDNGTYSGSEESHEPTSVLPSQRGFKLASLNINKLITHIDQLRILLADNEIDILSFNETKLNETISDNEVNISGYDIIRRDRITNGGGGVCFYVKSSINFTIRNDLNMDILENLCLEIRKPRSKLFVVATWYRPPDSPISIFSPFETLIGKLDSENIEYFLMGDLNCDMIATRYDNNTCKLMNITDIYGLQQLITEPTRITPTSATLIDVIYTNCPDKVVCSGVRHISISDHSIVFAYRKLSVNGMSGGHNAITYRNFRKFNRINFRNDIASHCWDHIYNSTDPNQMWLQWKCSFLSIVNKHAPLRTMRVRTRSSPWITSELKKRMHDRDILKIKASKSNDSNDWSLFKKQRNKVNSEIRLAKQAYYQNSFNKHTGDGQGL